MEETKQTQATSTELETPLKPLFTPPPPLLPGKKGMGFGTLFGIQILILLGSMLLLFVFSQLIHDGETFLFLSMAIPPIQVVILLIVSIVHFVLKAKEKGKVFLLLGLLFVFVGPATCFGIIMAATNGLSGL